MFLFLVRGYNLFTIGRFKITSKNFSRTANKADSAMAGLGSMNVLLPTNTSISDSFELACTFVATLCFFRKAAEKPDAQT
jgi:hypothetical protein